MDLLQSIDLYLRLGRQLTPLRGKVALLKGWPDKQVSRGDLMRHARQGGNIGWVLSRKDLVIDIDPRNGGKDAWTRLKKAIPVLENAVRETQTVITGNDGLHIIYQLPDRGHASKARDTLRAVLKSNRTGIDMLGYGHYVVIPGSVHPDTLRLYRPHPLSDLSMPVATAPRALFHPPREKEKGKEIEREEQEQSTSDAPMKISDVELGNLLAALPIKQYAGNEQWEPLLMAAHHATDGKGLDVFLRWSLSDPYYADQAGMITARWNSLQDKPHSRTIATILKEVKATAPKNSTLKNIHERFKQQAQPKTDVAYELAERVINKHFAGGEEILYGSDQRYSRFNGTHWEVVPSEFLRSIILREALIARSADKSINKIALNAHVTNAERLFRSMSAISTSIYSEEPRHIVNTKNVELHLKPNGTVEALKHKAESHLLHCINVEYDKAATCPRFNTALLEIFSDREDKEEVVRHLWELFGYIIQPHKNIASCVLFVGAGANGKTVVLNVLSALLGDAALPKSMAELDITRNNHALADLPGKLALIDEDLATGLVLPDGILKKISENKRMTANPKGAATFSFFNTAIPIGASNTWPNTRDLSNGLRRRLHVFEFLQVFDQTRADIGLSDYVIKNELSGVLNETLKGLQRLRNRGMFDVPESCRISLEKWYQASSPIHQFLEEVFSPKRGNDLRFIEVWRAYRDWAEEQKIKTPMTKGIFKKKLREVGCRVEIMYANGEYYMHDYEFRSDADLARARGTYDYERSYVDKDDDDRQLSNILTYSRGKIS
jgi:P4 family phage/plasmid primase-like protien